MHFRGMVYSQIAIKMRIYSWSNDKDSTEKGLVTAQNYIGILLKASIL